MSADAEHVEKSTDDNSLEAYKQTHDVKIVCVDDSRLGAYSDVS